MRYFKLMISISIIALVIKATFTITLINIVLNLTLCKSNSKLKLIFGNMSKFDDFEECRRLIQAEFEQNDIGPLSAFGLMLSMLTKILSILGFVVTMILYLCFITQ